MIKVFRFLRRLAIGLLLVWALVSVVFACCGAERCLDWMRYHVAIATLAGVALLALVVGIARAPARLLHLGLALVLGGWVYNAWTAPEDGSLRLRRGQVGQVADAGELLLEDFSIARWPDTHTVRQYESRVRAQDSAFDSLERTRVIAVNHPLVFRKGLFDPGWWVYQNSYQELTNPHTGKPLYFTILLCVRDNGLYFAFLGGLLLIGGAAWWAYRRLRFFDCVQVKTIPPASSPACVMTHRLFLAYNLVFILALAMLVHRGLATGHAPLQNMYEFLMCSAALIPILTRFFPAPGPRVHTLLIDAFLQMLFLVPVAFFMDGSVKRLMPALQSPFFVPHVGAYVLGYLILVRAALGSGRCLVGVGFFLLTVGLVLGAVWGKVCWGHWWQFDPKEMWSLATWCVYASYFHFQGRLSPRLERVFLFLGAVMIVLTLTWINLSRLFTGMHSYA